MENKKHLPVKIFQKRTSDERRTEGGGGSTDPKWLLSEDELLERAQEFLEELSITVDRLDQRAQEFDFIPTVLSLKIEDEAIAKSHRSDIKKLFNVNNKSNIIGFSKSHNLLVKVDSLEDALTIQDNMEACKKHKKAVSAIHTINNFEPLLTDYSEINDQDVFKVSLINFGDYSLNKAVKISFESYCKKHSIEASEVSYSPELIIYKVKNSGKQKIEKIESFAALESMLFMPKYQVSLDGSIADKSIEVKEFNEDTDYPTIGVLDSGIANIDHLSPWISGSYSSYPEPYTNKAHGTFVSGILIYGDELEGQNYTGVDNCKLFEAIVFPNTSIDEAELIDNIRDVIERHNDIKIWNMSLGTQAEADKDSFSDFGIALDNIQDSNNVLICKSAGNCQNFAKNRPVSRVSKSADSVRALVVGSIAHEKSAHDLSEKNCPSPFSRIGHGPSDVIKPELVSYGGNAGVTSTGRVTETGVSSFGLDGSFMVSVGTSFSTPRVTALLAGLHHNINDSFNPILLKALTIHSSTYPDGMNLSQTEKIKQMGFGLPAPVNEIIYNDPHEITLIQQDTLVKGEFFEILEFPYPENLIDSEGYFYGEVKITLVASPVLRENQGVEYCQSNIDVFFGTYDKLKERDVSKPSILNEIGLEGNENLIKGSKYSKHYHKDTTSKFANERMLLNYGDKYKPIKKWSVNLEEMTPTNKEKYLKSPKKWYLKVRGLYRDFAETVAVADGEELSQDFCLVITIKDTRSEQMVYDNVSQLLENRSFNHSDIKIRERVRTKL